MFTKTPTGKVEKILNGSPNSISSPPLKIQNMDGKVCLRCKDKTLLGVVNKLLKVKNLLTMPSNVFKQTFPPIIYAEGEGGVIESRLFYFNTSAPTKCTNF